MMLIPATAVLLCDVTGEELERQGLDAVLRERGVRPVVAHQSIGARMPTAAERRQLGQGRRAGADDESRSAFDAEDEPVEHCDPLRPEPRATRSKS